MVRRLIEEFFTTLNEWGVDGTKFVVLHHSILSEGINVKGLEGSIVYEIYGLHWY